jgi:MFS family permease
VSDEGRGGLGVLWLAAAVAAVHVLSFRDSGPLDDELILWRFARNLAEGHGPVFNPGQVVEGYSAPLWMLLIAGGLAMGLPAAATGFGFALLGAVLAVVATGLAWRRLHPDTQWYPPALLLAASPALGWHAVVGLGTVLMAGLVALWLWLWLEAWQRDEPAWGAAIALGLAGLMRTEAVLFALPFLVVEARRRRLPAALLALGPGLAWLVFRLAYYERWLPVTYHVKKLPLLHELRFGIVYLGVSTLTMGIGLLVLFALPLLVNPRPRTEAPLRAATFGLTLFVLYVVSVGGDFLELGRFFVPALPIAALLACAGFARVAGTTRAVGAVALTIALALTQWPQFFDRPALRMRHAEFEQRWQHVALELKSRVTPDTSVATSPIGALGWYSELPIIDMLGLTNDAVWRVAPNLDIVEKGHHRYDADWVLSESPDLVVLANAWLDVNEPGGTPTMVISAWERTLFEHGDFQSNYAPWAVDVGESYPLILYVRKDATPPRGARPL